MGESGDVMLSAIISKLVAFLIVMTKCLTTAAQRKKSFTESHLERTAHHDRGRHTSSARKQIPLTLRVSFSYLSSPNSKIPWHPCPDICFKLILDYVRLVIIIKQYLKGRKATTQWSHLYVEYKIVNEWKQNGIAVTEDRC